MSLIVKCNDTPHAIVTKWQLSVQTDKNRSNPEMPLHIVMLSSQDTSVVNTYPSMVS